MFSKGYIIPSAIIVFWLVMTGLFIRREILPVLPTLSQPSYEAYLKSLGGDKTIKMGIYFRGERIGSSQTEITSIENNHTKIQNVTTINLPAMMEILFASNQRKKKKQQAPLPPKTTTDANIARITFSGYSIIDRRYKLKSFSFSTKSPFLAYDINGEVRGDFLEFTLFDGQQWTTNSIPYKANSTISDGLSPFVSMSNLTVGKEWSVNVLNPFGASMQTLKARVENLTQIEWQDQMHDVYEVILSDPTGKSALNYTAYITPEGKILKQEILLPGLYLMRE